MRKELLAFMSLCVSASMMADPIGLERAKSLATSLMPADAEPILVKSAVRNESKSRMLSEETKSSAPYYIFSRGEGKGFVIVSGDDCLPEILGYTESGNYDEELLPPHLLGWLDHYANLIEDAQVNGVNTPNEARNRTSMEPVVRTATRQNVDPLVTAHWHQNWPYNNRCPFITGTTNRAVTGCVATAAAQVGYYWRKDNPPTLLATTPTYGYGDAPVTESIPAGTPMRWELMLDHYNGDRPAEYDDAVAVYNAAVGAATWLTYGSSTGGQISDLVGTYNNYFRLSSECLYKSSVGSHAEWENLIYTELSSKRPIVYSGYSDASGGHAVVLDGYQASTNLFHFNFGWGGQGDGWYTVNDDNGMNGFNQFQGMTYKIQPKKRNVKAEIVRPSKFYINRTNDIRLKINNNSTLDFSGVYLFMSTGSKPTSLSSAKDEDVETVIVNDGKDAYITLSCKPILNKPYTLWVTDDKMTVLATDTLRPTLVKSELQLLGVEVYGSADVETYNGEDYSVVYNSSKALCEINIANLGDIDYEGSPKIDIYGSKDNGETFEYVGTKTGKITIGAGKNEKTTINISNTSTCPIETGTLYRAVIVNPIKSLNTSDTLQYVNSDTIARFVLKEGDLAAVSYENRCLKLRGNWDHSQFLTLISGRAYKDATSFDLTEVKGVGSQPVCENNPNALFYVADDAAVTGYNIVRKSNSSCANLSLTAGYDFNPQADINVGEFTLDIAQEPNHWYLLTSPCAVDVPNGIIARQIDSHSRLSGINNKTTNVTVLEGGKTYLMMTSSAKKQTLKASDVVCTFAPAENVDTAFIGTYVATSVPAGAMLIDHVDDNFCPIEEEGISEGLRGYFSDEATKKKFRAYSNLQVDNKCLALGEAINACYAILEQYADVAAEEDCDVLAEAIGEAEKIFSERSLTVVEIGNVTGRLLQCAEDLKEQARFADNGSEIDCTGFITNPSFELGSTAGWVVGDKGVATAKPTSNLYYKGVGSDGDYLLNNLNSTDATGVAVSQTVKGLVPGLYRLSAMVGSDAGNTVTMFANDSKVTSEVHPFGKYYLTEVLIDSIAVGSDGMLTIGIEAGQWYKADDFRLTLIEESVADMIEGVVSQKRNPSIAVMPVSGGISITTLNAVPVAVCSMTGQCIWSKTVCGTVYVNLPSGIYVIGGKKVVVM